MKTGTLSDSTVRTSGLQSRGRAVAGRDRTSLAAIRDDMVARDEYLWKNVTRDLSKWARMKNLRIPVYGVGLNYGEGTRYRPGSDTAISLFASDILNEHNGVAKEKLWYAGVRFLNNDRMQNEVQESHIEQALDVMFATFERCLRALGGGTLSHRELQIYSLMANRGIEKYSSNIPLPETTGIKTIHITERLSGGFARALCSKGYMIAMNVHSFQTFEKALLISADRNALDDAAAKGIATFKLDPDSSEESVIMALSYMAGKKKLN